MMQTHYLLVLGVVLSITCVGTSQQRPKSTRAAIKVTGARADSLKGAPATLLTIKASRLLSRTRVQQVSVAHALIFYPESSVIAVGGGFSNDAALSIVTVKWTVQKNPPNDFKNTDEKLVEVRCNLVEKTVTVGSEKFRLSNGNLFIIRLSDIWQPASTQITAQLTEVAERQKVLDSFKSAVPDDQLIQKLELQLPDAAFGNGQRPAARLQSQALPRTSRTSAAST